MVSAGVVVSGDECSLSCEGKEPGEWVADPYNCTQFYLCLEDGSPSDHPLPCDQGHFEDGTCQGQSLCDPPCITGYCDIVCKRPLHYIADRFDCSIYYLCSVSNDALGPYTCPEDKPFFNGQSCTADQDKCCKRDCMPYCNATNTQIIDPTDCHNYYICLELGPAHPDYLFFCTNGWGFDIASGHCSQDAHCEVLCPEGAQTPHAPAPAVERPPHDPNESLV